MSGWLGRMPRGQVAQGFRVKHGHLQQGPCRAGRVAPALFPILQRSDADAKQVGKLGLRQAYAAAGFADA